MTTAPIELIRNRRPDAPDGRPHALVVFGVPLARFDDAEAAKIEEQLGALDLLVDVRAHVEARIDAHEQLRGAKAASTDRFVWGEWSGFHDGLKAVLPLLDKHLHDHDFGTDGDLVNCEGCGALNPHAFAHLPEPPARPALRFPLT